MARPFLILVVGLVAGCGAASSQPPDDVVQRLLAGKDGASRCSEVYSERFVREVYAGAGRCRSAEETGDGAEFKGARAAAPRVDGDRATVRIAFASGGSGTIALARDGGAWKVDRYDDPLLRAMMISVLVQQIRLTASKPGLNLAGTTECVHDWSQAMDPARFRRFVFDAFVNDQRAEKPMEDAIAGCLTDPRSGSGGRSYLRIYLVREVVSAARGHGYDAGSIACIRRRMRSLSDREVREHVERDKSAPPPATRRIAAILASCG